MPIKLRNDETIYNNNSDNKPFYDQQFKCSECGHWHSDTNI